MLHSLPPPFLLWRRNLITRNFIMANRCYVFALLIATCFSMSLVRNRTLNVDTRIGTGGFGFGIGEINPGPTMPFGSLRLGPDTSLGLEPIRIPFQTYAGYAYDATFVECFSHTHVVGAGLGDFQNFGVTVTRQWNNDQVRNSGYRSRFSHNQEVALPGYYAVELLSHNTYAEVTVSGTFSAMHRYTCRSLWPSTQDAPCVLVLDVCHGFPKTVTSSTKQCKQAQVFNISSSDGGNTYEVDAYMMMDGAFSGKGPLGGLQMYLHMIVSAVSTTSGEQVPLAPSMWEDGNITSDLFTELTTSGSLGIGFITPTPTNGSAIQFEVRSGLSFVSRDNAKLNLVTQQRSTVSQRWMSFEESAQTVVDAWESILASVQYQGGVGDDAWHRTVFDSTLYRSHLAPSTYSEVNGQFLGMDMKVHTVAAPARQISDLSIWDIYRTQAPMLLFTKPDIAKDFVDSMLRDYSYNHELPKWVFANIECNSMVGRHSAVIFADYASKGLYGVNATYILDVIATGLSHQNSNLLPYGFVPLEASSDGASNTQDYAIDAGAVVYLAQFLGDNATAAKFLAFSQDYKNVWDDNSQFFCPRWSNKSFQCPPLTLTYPFGDSYTEGDAWQYRWYAPHDVRGLISLFNSTQYFVDELYSFFADSDFWILNNTLPNWYFWAGNEPDLQTPMLFNWAGNEYAYLTSLIFPQLLDEYYIPYASGVPGDDDYGAMSAWCFWGYVGVFPMVPSAEYALFAPRFDAIDFTLDPHELSFSPWRNVNSSSSHVSNNRTAFLRIRCTGRPSNGATAYVTSITLNGEVLPTPIVTHSQLLGDGTSPAILEFQLSGEAGVYGMAPPSLGGPPIYTPMKMKK